MTARLIVERDGPILVLTLSNPEMRNALGPDIYGPGIDALERAGADDSIGAVVLTGEGSVFCAGGNLNRIRENRERDPQVQRDSIDKLHAWIRAIRRCEKPVFASVEGACAGAGFSLALACDRIVAARDAKFTLAYVKVGLSPDGGATFWLTERLPYMLAFELMSTGRIATADELAHHGLVGTVVDPGAALATAITQARALAAGPRRVIGRLKRLASRREDERLDAHLDAEREAFVESSREPDAAEGVDAFLEKRAPRFGSAPNEH